MIINDNGKLKIKTKAINNNMIKEIQWETKRETNIAIIIVIKAISK